MVGKTTLGIHPAGTAVERSKALVGNKVLVTVDVDGQGHKSVEAEIVEVVDAGEETVRVSYEPARPFPLAALPSGDTIIPRAKSGVPYPRWRPDLRTFRW